MLRQAKRFFTHFLGLIRAKKSGELPVNMRYNTLEVDRVETKSEPLINEEKRMLKYNDLLTLDREKFMSNDFCVLRKNATIAKARAFLGVLQKSGYIIITDSSDKFLGIITDISILREFPADEKYIPYSYQIAEKNSHKEVINSIDNAADKIIQDVFILEQNYRKFYREGAIIDVLQELEKPYSYYAQSKVVPLLNIDHSIAGVISYIEILKFIKEKQVIDNKTVKEAFSEKDLSDNLCTLAPENTLASAYFLIKYLPTEYVLICDKQDNKYILHGWLDKRKITPMVHPLYRHLRSMPVNQIMESVNSLYLIEPNETLKNVINFLLKSGREIAANAVVIVKDKTASELQPLGILTPISILQFFIKFLLN